MTKPKACECGHRLEDHGLYFEGGTNRKGSRWVCQKDNCHSWNQCDLKIEDELDGGD